LDAVADSGRHAVLATVPQRRRETHLRRKTSSAQRQPNRLRCARSARGLLVPQRRKRRRGPLMKAHLFREDELDDLRRVGDPAFDEVDPDVPPDFRTYVGWVNECGVGAALVRQDDAWSQCAKAAVQREADAWLREVSSQYGVDARSLVESARKLFA